MKKEPDLWQSSDSVRHRIYDSLYHSKAFCTRQTLAKECGISMPTLYQHLNDLMDDGLVRFSGKEKFTGGRRAQGLEIVPDARISIGISVTEQTIRLVAADLKLQELAFRELPFDLVGYMKAENDSALAAILETFLDDAAIDREVLLGVGITIPGVLNTDHTRILFAPTLKLRDMPLSLLTRDIPYPVYVDNDGSASGHAESFFCGDGGNLAYLSLENGVGGAVLINGQPYNGNNARSGEFGHICVQPGGLRCSCGKLGCLEAYCSPRRIEESFGATLEEFFRGVEEHNPEYENLFYDMLRHLATGIQTIRMILNCDVVIGGFVSEYLQPYLPLLRRYVEAGDPFQENADYVRLSRLRHHITPLGAALHFVRSFIEGV